MVARSWVPNSPLILVIFIQGVHTFYEREIEIVWLTLFNNFVFYIQLHTLHFLTYMT